MSCSRRASLNSRQCITITRQKITQQCLDADCDNEPKEIMNFRLYKRLFKEALVLDYGFSFNERQNTLLEKAGVKRLKLDGTMYERSQIPRGKLPNISAQSERYIRLFDAHVSTPTFNEDTLVSETPTTEDFLHGNSCDRCQIRLNHHVSPLTGSYTIVCPECRTVRYGERINSTMLFGLTQIVVVNQTINNNYGAVEEDSGNLSGNHTPGICRFQGPENLYHSHQ